MKILQFRKAYKPSYTTNRNISCVNSISNKNILDCVIFFCRVSVKIEGEERYNPWSQPGTAPVYGEGCGANGGNPNGCNGDNEDSSSFGTCCGGSQKNGHWKSGKYKLM